jgi:hypothetical protein
VSPAGIGEPLGDFALSDLGGRAWSAADLRASPTVVFCFATW